MAWIISGIIQTLFGDIINIMSMSSSLEKKAIDYSETDHYGSNAINIRGMIMYFLGRVLYIVISLHYLKKYKNCRDWQFIETFVVIGLLFMVFENRMGIFGRFVDFYRIYFAILFASFQMTLVNRTRGLRKTAYLKSLLVFSIMFFSIGVDWFYKTSYPLYNPYSSVVVKHVDQNRERLYNKQGIKTFEY